MTKSLKNLIALSQKVKIYVPSTVDVNIAADNSKYVEKSLKLLACTFGGATSYQAFGAWLSQSGELVKESITVCEAFCKESDLQKSIEIIYDFCLELKLELKQEAIALEVNGVLHFV
jgi:hypothetical protein